MVIYLFWRKKIIHKIFIFVFMLFLVYCLSYGISSIRFDDKKYIEISGLLEENRVLKNELLELGDITLTNGIVGKVILRDLYSFYDEIILNVGSEDGVVKDSAVINEYGLVGIVSKVDKNKSYVKLLSSNYNISVKVNDNYGNYNNGRVTMIDKYTEIKEGDIVYTSGLDNVVGNIFLGKVTKVKLDSDGLGKELEIDYVNNKNLNYVYVVGSLE